MKIEQIVLCLTFLLTALPASVTAAVTVSVVDVPTSTDGVFSAHIAGGDPDDRTPNPCYRSAPGTCDLYFFTIDQNWLPGGLGGYKTADYQTWSYQPGSAAFTAPTIGEWWSSVTNKGRVSRDFLPHEHYVKGPCVVLAAARDQHMIAGTIVSNCAKGLVQVPSCAIVPGTLIVSLDVGEGADVGATAVPGVTLNCTSAADVRIETNDRERIPLNGNNASVVVLDWGEGFGEPATIHMSRAGNIVVPLRVKTAGVGGLGAGAYSGSTVVNLTYQ